MNAKTSSLTDGELEAAVWLSLAAAANTDLDQVPQGAGDHSRRKHHERKRRFEQALTKLRTGSSLPELGLFPEDCAWAAEYAHFAKDKERWLSHFRSAESELREASLRQTTQVLSEPR